MRRLSVAALLGAAFFLSSCYTNDVTGPVYREYIVDNLNIQEFFDNRANEYVEVVTFGVRTDGGSVVTGAEMYYSVDLGVLESADQLSDADGIARATWTLLPSERFANPRPAISVCANNTGTGPCNRTFAYRLGS